MNEKPDGDDKPNVDVDVDHSAGYGEGRRTATIGGRQFPLKIKLMSCGLALSTLTLFIRAIYRTIELSNGWRGRVIHTQVYFSEFFSFFRLCSSFCGLVRDVCLSVYRCCLQSFLRRSRRGDDRYFYVRAQLPPSWLPALR